MANSRPKPETTSTGRPSTPLLEAIKSLAPIAREHGLGRVIVAQSTRHRLETALPLLPANVTVTPCVIRGPRQRKRLMRYGSFYHVAALWPNDRLDEARIPLIVCVTEGEATLRIADYVLRCPAGYFVIVPVGVPYGGFWRPHSQNQAVESADSSICCICAWQGSATRIQCWMQHARDGRLVGAQTQESGIVHDPRTDHYFQAVINEVTAPETNCYDEWQHICNGALNALLSSLAREIKCGRITYSNTATTRDELRHRDGDPISQAQNYILAHLNQHLTIDHVARAVYMSRVPFTQNFRRTTGQSFIEFLTHHRLEEARRVLREADWPVREVARGVGLSPSRLRDLFNLYEGMSPQNYRRKNR